MFFLFVVFLILARLSMCIYTIFFFFVHRITKRVHIVFIVLSAYFPSTSMIMRFVHLPFTMILMLFSCIKTFHLFPCFSCFMEFFEFNWISWKIQNTNHNNVHMYFVFMSTTSNLKCFSCVITALKCSNFTDIMEMEERQKIERKKKNPFSHIMKQNMRPLSMPFTTHIHHHLSFNIPVFPYNISNYASGARGLHDITIKWFNDFDVVPEKWLFLWALPPLFYTQCYKYKCKCAHISISWQTF